MLSKAVSVVEDILSGVSKMSLFVMMILISLDTAGRYFFNSPFHGTLEVTEMYLMGAVVFLGMSYTLRNGGHISINLVARRFNRRVRVYLDFIFNTLSLLLFGIIAYRSAAVTFHAFINNEVTMGIVEWPVSLSWLLVALGTVLLTLRLLIMIIGNLGELMGESGGVVKK